MMDKTLNRRNFIKGSIAGIAGVSTFGGLNPAGLMAKDFAPLEKSQVALIKTTDRKAGVKTLLDMLDYTSEKDRNILLKPNFNTADPAPASTHNDTLFQLILELQQRGATSVTIGERSNRNSDQVLIDKGVSEFAENNNVSNINFETLPDEKWHHFKHKELSWKDGIYIPQAVMDADYIVTTCCLKTHFVGIITMSLKLCVGMVRPNMMRELHGDRPNLPRKVAEINLAYKPELIVMDGVLAFTDGGPSKGTLAEPGVMIAGTDRIAVDAVGVAVLKEQGSNETIMGKPVFDQMQIARAAELGLGITSPDQIEIITLDEVSKSYADNLSKILNG